MGGFLVCLGAPDIVTTHALCLNATYLIAGTDDLMLGEYDGLAGSDEINTMTRPAPFHIYSCPK